MMTSLTGSEETRNTRTNSFLALTSIENALDRQKNAFLNGQKNNAQNQTF